MICSSCGHQNEASGKFCASCGKTFDAPADGPAVTCGSCGATVHAPPGVGKCNYCGARVDIPGVPQTHESGNAPIPFEDERSQRSYLDDDVEPPQESSSSGILIASVAVAVIVVIAIAVVAGKSRHRTSTSRAEKKATTVTAATTTTKPSQPAYVDSVPITSCRCSFGDGQSQPLVTLTLQAPPLAEPTRAIWLGIARKSGFVSESGSQVLSLPSGAVLATPLDGGALPTQMGVACDTGIYVLVAGKTATGWSSINASWKWNATLPSAMMQNVDAGAPAQSAKTNFASYCMPLAVQNGGVTVALANGKRATLSLADGKVR